MADSEGCLPWIWTTTLLLLLWGEKFFLSFLNWRILTLAGSALKTTYCIYSVHSMYVSGWNRFNFCYRCIRGGACRVRNEAESQRQFIVKMTFSSAVIQNIAWITDPYCIYCHTFMLLKRKSKGQKWWYCSKLEDNNTLKEKGKKHSLGFGIIKELCICNSRGKKHKPKKYWPLLHNLLF